MKSIPYVTRILAELASRNPAYASVFGAAEVLQNQLMLDGVISRNLLRPADDLSARATAELENETENMLGAIMLAQMGNLDHYSAAESLRCKFREAYHFQMETYETYFSRHTVALDIDDATRRRLWEDRRIAIHFPWLDNDIATEADSQGLNIEEYRDNSSRRAIGAIMRLAKDGGYVCSQHYPREEVLVGYVPKNSKVELIEGVWGNRCGLAGRVAILKTLRLEKTKIVDPIDCVVLLVARPRQGTLMRWRLIRNVVRNLVEGLSVKPELASLPPSQQEIMCSEFLRTSAAKDAGLPELANLLLPVGRTMKDLDILALALDGKKILAQVTYAHRDSNEGSMKLQRLKHYANQSACHLILFCDCDSHSVVDGVTIFPLEEVFSLFTKWGHGQDWLRLSC